MGEGGWLKFAASIHRSVLFTGEDVGVYIDTDWQGAPEYRLKLHQSGAEQFLELTRAHAGGWTLDTPRNTSGGYLADGQMYLWVHRSELGWPENGVYFAAFSSGGQYGGVMDYAPNEGTWFLPPPTQVGGASGPGVEPTPPAVPPLQPQPPTPTAPTAPAPPNAPAQLTPAEGKAAVRKLLDRRLPAHARSTVSRCRTLSNRTAVRCRVTARDRSRRWSGVAETRVLASETYATTFTGRRWRTSCRSCSTRVRWSS